MDKKTIDSRLSGIMFVVLFCIFQGCASHQTIPQISNSLPPNELAYYSDSFDELRNDLWDPTGLLYRQEQVKNYRSADMRIENGQLVLRTHVGSFSKGGLGSKFMLRGDYDVQIDCQFNFMKDTVDMDQILSIALLEQEPVGHETRGLVCMTLIKVPGKESKLLFNYRDFRDWERILKIGWHSTGDFNGTFRIVRAGKRIFTSYRRGDGPWRRADVFPSIGGDTHLAMICQNFNLQRKSIHATRPVTGRFDSFRINAAQGIVEEEI